MRLRLGLTIGIWALALIAGALYFWQARDYARFNFFLSQQGVVIPVQYETWFNGPREVQPGDRLLFFDGQSFTASNAFKYLQTKKPGAEINIKFQRGDKVLTSKTTLKRHSKQSVFTLFIIPTLLSLIFMAFAVGILLQRGAIRVNRESVEIFSNFCVIVSFLFLGIFPILTLGLPFSYARIFPFLSVMFMHLFLTYPKRKGPRSLRWSLLGLAYASAAGLAWVGEGVLTELQIPLMGFSFFVSMAALGNTLLTAKDFWARRRARIMSLVFLATFIGTLGAFVSFLWEGPWFSIERILALSLFFPTAFAAVLFKSNVFDLERIFRRGLHQLVLLAIAVTFALVVGVGWDEWMKSTEEEWMLWVAIAIVVLLISNPLARWLEAKAHDFIRTKVKYPQVNDIFERSHRLEEFLSAFSYHCETHLAMRDIGFRFFSDPTNAWKPENEQVWVYRNSAMERAQRLPHFAGYRNYLQRGDVKIGEIVFEGGDALAFDPATSEDWQETIRTLARCIEVLCLREFIGLQQGFLAVGRMQALLAHELKNPLAIIKVCSGLLQSHLHDDEEAEELVKTIQGEVNRVSSAVQAVFSTSGRAEQKEKINLREVLKDIKERLSARFATRDIQIQRELIEEDLFVWTEKESLKQALTNLMINAFEAGSQWVMVSSSVGAGGFSLSVRDAGPGLPKNVDIFKPFVTTKAGGTGLGLAQVKAFVERNSGYIRLSSQEKQGSIFVLEFPQSFVFNERSV